jgi:hypothetical protein
VEQDVLGQREQVVRHDVLAAVDKGARPRGGD